MWLVIFAIAAAVIQLLVMRVVLNSRREDERGAGWRSWFVWVHLVLFFVLMWAAVVRTVDWVF